LVEAPRDRAIMRRALHPILESARSRLKLLERDERHCGRDDGFRLAEIKGERRAWEHIRSDLTIRIARLRDETEEIL